VQNSLIRSRSFKDSIYDAYLILIADDQAVSEDGLRTIIGVARSRWQVGKKKKWTEIRSRKKKTRQ